MKKLLFSLSLLASLATIAGESEIDCSAQTFGVLPITSPSTEVIVAVPWVAASSSESDAPISVSNIIKTANLTVGDWIRVWDQGDKTFKVWNLVLNETTNVKYWDISKTVSPSGTATSTNSVDATLQRGDALVLHRQNPGSGSGNTFYVFGQVTSTACKSITVAQGTSPTKANPNGVPAYTMLANPSVSDSSPNSWTWSTGDNAIYGGKATRDTIVYGESSTMGTQVYHNGKSWGYSDGNLSWTAAPDIKAGVGVWYVSRGGNPTITF